MPRGKPITLLCPISVKDLPNFVIKDSLVSFIPQPKKQKIKYITNNDIISVQKSMKTPYDQLDDSTIIHCLIMVSYMSQFYHLVEHILIYQMITTIRRR